MDWQRTTILGAIAVVSVLLINQWGEFQERNRPVVSQETTSSTTIPEVATSEIVNSGDIPTAIDPKTDAMPTLAAPRHAQLISVKTDHLEMLIDTKGGDIVKVALPQHLESLSGDP